MASTDLLAAAQAGIANQGQLDALQNQLNGHQGQIAAIGQTMAMQQGQMAAIGRTMAMIGITGLLTAVGLPKIISVLANQYFGSQRDENALLQFNVSQFTLSLEEQEKLLADLKET